MKFAITLTAVSIVAAAGCQNDHSAPHPQDEQSRFEQMHDPPINAQTYFAAGQLAESQGRYGDALVAYKKSMEIAPRYPDPLFRTGLVYTQQRNFPEAIATWNRYIALTGGSAAAYSDLGVCEETAGDSKAAIRAFQEGIDRDPTAQPCHVNYGLLLARQGRIDEALTQFQTVLTPAQAHYNLASVYESQGRPGQARAEYRKAVELDPSLDDARVKLASLPQ